MNTWGVKLKSGLWLQNSAGDLVWALNKEQIQAYLAQQPASTIIEGCCIASFQNTDNQADDANKHRCPSKELDTASHFSDVESEGSDAFVSPSVLPSSYFVEVEAQPRGRRSSAHIILFDNIIICHVRKFFKALSHRSKAINGAKLLQAKLIQRGDAS